MTRLPKILLFSGGIAGLAILSSCGGTQLGGNYSAQFLYVPTGTNINQYALGLHGELLALTPATATATNAVAITTSSKGDFAYAVNQSDTTILQYKIPATGALTALTPPTVTTGAGVLAITESPNGKFVYAMSSTAIYQYSVGVSGALTALTPPSVPVASDGDGLVVAPGGGFLYASSYGSNAVSAYSIGVDGTLTPLSTPTYTVNSPSTPVISADGLHMYVPSSTDGVAQFSIAGDGSLTPLTPATVASPGLGNDCASLSIDGKYLYLGVFNGGFAGSPVAQYSIAANGTLTALTPASVAAGNAPAHMVSARLGSYVYVVNTNDGSVSLFKIGADGTLSANSPATVTIAGARGIATAAQ